MTERELAIVKALGAVRFLPGHPHKRFAKNMAALASRDPARELTEKQSGYLTTIAWRYRRQMPAQLAYPVADDELVLEHIT